MARKKVKLAWIVRDSDRKASLKKRRNCLLKKVRELSTLCGVSAFIIIYSPNDPEPRVWPLPPEIQQIIHRYESLPQAERQKNMINQDNYLEDRIRKFHEKNMELHKRNKEADMSYLMLQIEHNVQTYDTLDMNELHGLQWYFEEKLKELQGRLENFKLMPFPAIDLDLPTQDPNEPSNKLATSNGCDQSTNDSSNAALMRDQWYHDVTNNNGNDVAGSSTGIRSELGLPTNTYIGSSNIANDPSGPQSHGGVNSYSSIGHRMEQHRNVGNDNVNGNNIPQYPIEPNNKLAISNGCDKRTNDSSNEAHMWDQWLHDLMNNSEKDVAGSCTDMRSELRLPTNAYIGNSSTTNDPSRLESYSGVNCGSSIGHMMQHHRNIGNDDVAGNNIPQDPIEPSNKLVIGDGCDQVTNDSYNDALMQDQWFLEIMNNSGKDVAGSSTNMRSELGPSTNTYIGGSSIANNPSSLQSLGGVNSGSSMGHVMQHHRNTGNGDVDGNNISGVDIGHMGLGLYPHQGVEGDNSSIEGNRSDMNVLPFGVFSFKNSRSDL